MPFILVDLTWNDPAPQISQPLDGTLHMQFIMYPHIFYNRIILSNCELFQCRVEVFQTIILYNVIFNIQCLHDRRFVLHSLTNRISNVHNTRCSVLQNIY